MAVDILQRSFPNLLLVFERKKLMTYIQNYTFKSNGYFSYFIKIYNIIITLVWYFKHLVYFYFFILRLYNSLTAFKCCSSEVLKM